MVTYLKFYKDVKSYYYRKTLLENLPNLESKIMDFLNEKELLEIKLPGYFVSIRNGSLIITNTPNIPLNQLKIEFKEDEKK